MRGSLGGAYLGYEERFAPLDSESDYDSGSLAVRVAAEAWFGSFVPRLEAASLSSWGTEEARAPGRRQEDALFVGTALLDAGLGYRIELSSAFWALPSLAYTFHYLGFERSDFRINGASVTVLDLDGRPHDSVGEEIFAHGVSPGLALEFALAPGWDGRLYGAYTFFPEVSVDNDIGGRLSSRGALARAGASVGLRLGDWLSVEGRVEVGYQRLENSRTAVRTGLANSASVVFPDSVTVWVLVGGGIELRF
ncbi:MAG: hypothetical protein D6731_26030 [Planctomycetota bacterium]|nr:MAG: hypothetical protein D6731_26030 [Planctomycetota bacterium]